jgi:hypothetical protein
MYSHEIQQLLELRNFIISNIEYFNIVDTSPQINRVRYNPYCDEFETWTSDNYYFKYKVYLKKG